MKAIAIVLLALMLLVLPVSAKMSSLPKAEMLTILKMWLGQGHWDFYELAADTFCLSGDSCITSWPSGGGVSDMWIDEGAYLQPNTSYADDIYSIGEIRGEQLTSTDDINAVDTVFAPTISCAVVTATGGITADTIETTGADFDTLQIDGGGGTSGVTINNYHKVQFYESDESTPGLEMFSYLTDYFFMDTEEPTSWFYIRPNNRIMAGFHPDYVRFGDAQIYPAVWGDYAEFQTDGDLFMNDSSICIEDYGGASCSGSTDGFIYADDYIEHTHLWDDSYGSSSDALKSITGEIVEGKAVINYSEDNCVDPICVRGYNFPKEVLLIGTEIVTDIDGTKIENPIYEDFDEITQEEFYEQLSEADKQKVTVGYGTSIGGKVEALRDLALKLEEENQMLKAELCLKDTSYSWCNGAVTP